MLSVGVSAGVPPDFTYTQMRGCPKPSGPGAATMSTPRSGPSGLRNVA